MKIVPTFATFSALLAGILSMASCASAPPQEETALIQAGFHTVLPETVSERNAYEALPPYTVQRTEAPGRPVYAYYDKGQKVTYVGEAADYKRYKAFSQQKELGACEERVIPLK
jgi:hypothetical protein